MSLEACRQAHEDLAAHPAVKAVRLMLPIGHYFGMHRGEGADSRKHTAQTACMRCLQELCSQRKACDDRKDSDALDWVFMDAPRCPHRRGRAACRAPLGGTRSAACG